jgi:archaeosortase C (PEF-CTERM variant)
MLSKNKFNLLIFLLVLALFTGATIEFSEGSVFIGVLLIGIAFLLMMRVRFEAAAKVKAHRPLMLLGAFIIVADVVYNLHAANQLGTIDTMTFFLGASLIAYGAKREELRRMGRFGTYMSATFLSLFITFYSVLPKLRNEVIHDFDHYFVLLPTVNIIQLLGIPVQVVARETVWMRGAEDMTVIIGGPCSGLYSMFLLTSIVVGYSQIEQYEDKRKLFLMIPLVIVVAYVANLVRVTALYVAGYYYGTETMLTVHVHLGWVIFAVVATVIMYLLTRIK